ncbi:MAG: cofactor-independent phosphoglycerate mutase, partial [Acidimicrobiia bacterium]
MKYVVLVPDGCADEPVRALDGRTPLEAAHLPNLQALARRSEVGRADVIPGGLPPGSDVGNLSILGYDPQIFHTGRAPIEAAAMGVDLGPDEVAYRCNLVTLGADDTMLDFAAGHISSEQSHPIIAALDAELGHGRDGVRFYPGVEYRHLVVVPGEWLDADCTPPHDLTGKPAVWPTGAAAPRLRALMDASRPVVAAAAAEVDSVATQVWLWGQGRRPQLPDFAN